MHDTKHSWAASHIYACLLTIEKDELVPEPFCERVLADKGDDVHGKSPTNEAATLDVGKIVDLLSCGGTCSMYDG